jgi:hypothetical protein
MATPASPGPVLTTSQYTEPGVYIGEILNPEASNLSVNARIPAIIAKGSTYAVADNVGIIRAFVYNEQLNFSKTPPFVAPLQHFATGQQQLPNQLFQADGTVLTIAQWQYLKDGNGNYYQVQISDQAYNPLVTYYMDYQSTDVDVRDQIPIAELRQILEVGVQVDQSQYNEYQSFYVPMSFTAPQGDISNVHTVPWLDPAVIQHLQPGSTGSVVFDASAQYLHDYDRSYVITCLSASGTTPNRTATFSWSSALESGGNAAQPPVPLNVADTAPTFTINENTPPSLVETIQFGVLVDLAFGAVNFVAGDTFTYVGHGPSLLEIDQRYNNPQFSTVTSNFVSGNAGNLQIAIPDSSNYLLTSNNSYSLKLLSVSGVTPNRVMQFCWARYGDLVQSTNGNFTILENNPTTLVQPLTDGVQISFIVGPTSPIVGALWNIVAQAPRIYYKAKDSRIYNINVASITSPAINLLSINGGYSTNTPEGGFGVFSVTFDTTGANNGALGTGFNNFPDNISVAFRNFPSFAPLDIFTFSVLDSDLMDWSLDVQVQQVFQLTDYRTDMNGVITGTAGQQYVILSQVPANQDSIQVQNYNTSAQLSFNWVIGTPYIYFTTAPGVPITVSYQTLAPQPSIGQTYYMTVVFLRPTSYYNNPFLVLRLDDGRNFAAPSTISNDLYQGNEIFWANGGLAVYLVQPQNLDGSGVYSTPDYDAAITSIRSFPRITDLCLLNFPDGLSQLLEENVLANDPFQQRPNLVWWGMPIGTPIGDETTPGSLVYEALQSLSVTGNSPAHGTRILVGETEATIDVVLSSGQTATVTVDGSFIALAGASLVASFADPATDILGGLINGFSSITLYTKEQQLLLGAAQILYINGSAGGPYTWGEDTTVDPNQGFNLIQLMTQRRYVTQVVIRNMGTLIGIVPVSTQAAEALIQGNLASILRGLLAQGLIGQYQDSNGNQVAFDPNVDIIVFSDVNDPTLFFFNYAWFSRNVIKRLYGLYSLNSTDFSTGVALQSS